MNKIKIELPARFEDYKLHHIAGLVMLSKTAENYNPTMLNKCKIVAAILGREVEDVKQWDVKDLNRVYNHCVTQLNKYVTNEPPKQITLAGTVYERIELDKQTGGWLIDYEARVEEFEMHPELFLAMLYIEHGKKYGEVPTEERAAVFYKHMPAFVVLDANGFFLLKSARYIRAMALIMKARIKATMLMSRIKTKATNNWFWRK
jgi:hypothetical protein